MIKLISDEQEVTKFEVYGDVTAIYGKTVKKLGTITMDDDTGTFMWKPKWNYKYGAEFSQKITDILKHLEEQSEKIEKSWNKLKPKTDW